MKLKPFNYILILYFVIMLGLQSCKKEIIYEWPKGDLKGTVKLYDYQSNSTDYSGIQIAIDGNRQGLSAVTNNKGEFVINGLETGIYDIVFSKDSFGTYKMTSFQFLGGKEPMFLDQITLVKLPVFSISISNIISDGYSINAILSNTGKGDYMRYFIGDFSDVSYKKYQYSGYGSIYSSSIQIFQSNSIPYPPGTTIYLIVYPASSYSIARSYTDVSSGVEIFSDINCEMPSNVSSYLVY